ncbi:MAG: TlpA family protein disulfide reductase, partial [Planctomycetaceae bacterium]
EITKDLALKSRNFEMFRNYMSLATRDISTTYRAEPKTAELSVEKLKAAIDDFRESRPEYKAMLASYERSISSYERRIASALKILEMIGQPAPEMDVAAWVTQDGDKPVDLNGKVILLDFWAVWCGPCIRTFPHLKHLDETYGDKGLQIVGVTRYYNYTWNEKTEKAVRGQKADADLEHDALRKFLASHGLKHPTIVVPKESEMQRNFGVSGIPHAVVIDQNGAIQLIKVGSGEANAVAIEAKIKELLK